MEKKQEKFSDVEDVMFENDVEELLELLELSEAGEIKQTKTFLNNKKRCREKVMKKFLKDYAEKKQRIAKMEMFIALVTVFPNLIGKSGILSFKNCTDKFSAQILANENTMFCISDFMAICTGGDFNAAIFLTSLCYGQVVFGGQKDETEGKPNTNDDSRN